MCSKGCFEADPLRMLRAIRFARQLSCEIEPGTWESMLCSSSLIVHSARERIKRELFTVLHEHDKGKSLRELHDSGLLAHLFPAVGMIERDNGNHSLEFVSFEHCLRTVDFLDAIQLAPDDRLVGVLQQLSDYVDQDLEEGVSMLSLLVFAAFLAHAAGSQYDGDAGDSLEYYGHEMSLTKTAQHIACETGFGRKAQHIVACLYAQRMRIAQMAQLETLPERVKVRFVLDCGECAVGVCLLAIADSLARASGLERQCSSRRVTDVAYDLCSWILSSQDVREASPLLTGNDVISLLGLGAGPRVGNILKQAAQLERSGELLDRKAALLWLRNLHPNG
jgi:poly(A) polymerase